MVQVIDKNGKLKLSSSGGGAAIWGGITGTLSDQVDLDTALSGKEPTVTATTSADYYRGDKTFQLLNKAAVGLSNVDNTADSAKPVSTAQATAIGLKEDSSNKSTSTADSGSSVKYPVWTAITSFFTASQIRSILGISTLSGSNTGDQTNTSGLANSTDKNLITDAQLVKVAAIDQVFTATEKTKLGLAYTIPVKNTTDSAGHTGTVTETIITSLSVPAGTFALGDIMKIVSLDEKLLAGGALQIKYYVNTVNSLAGANAVFLYSSAASLKSIGTSREFILKPSNVIYGHSQTANNVIITESGTANVPLNLTFNYTGAFFIIKTFVLGNTGDNAIGKSFRVEKIG